MTAAPELVFLSRNPCPNSGPDWLYGTDCGSVEGSMTVWGYCNTCWNTTDAVPDSWRARVEHAILAVNRSLGIPE